VSTDLQIVPGSIADMAARNHGQVIPPALCVIFDISYSMRGMDARLKDGTTASRFTAGAAALTELQAQYPGQIVLIDFADAANVRPGGYPDEPIGNATLLAPALHLARELDTGQMTFVIISDGLPQDEALALEVAHTFGVGIDTIAVGEANRGCAYLERLARETGGTYHRDASQMRQLTATIRALLPGGITPAA
jgi:hypothetical protein